jgi:hypothetical protein
VRDAPYRAPLPVPPDPYAVAWADLRRRRVWTFVFMIAYLVTLLGVFYATRLHLPGSGPASVAWGLLSAVSSFLYPTHRFRCPHCGHKEAVWKKCSACGIRVGTPKSAVVEAAKPRVGAPAEQPAAAVRYRVAESRVDAGADGVNDVAADTAGRAHTAEGEWPPRENARESPKACR